MEARWLRYLTFVWGGIGLLALASASSALALYQNDDSLYLITRQVIFVLVGICSFSIIVSFPMERWFKVCGILYLVVLAMVVATHFGTPIHGSTRWLRIGIPIQPSEFFKPLLVVQASLVFGRWYRLPVYYRGIWLVLFAFGLGAILQQPDLGTTAICAGTLLLMAIVAGLSARLLWGATGLLVMLAGLSITFRDYQRRRVWGLVVHAFAPLFSPEQVEAASQNQSFQLIQSLQAIGSGGLFGRGYGLSDHKLFHLPVQHTDFIFSVYAEELGLIGTLFFLGLLAAFTAIALRVACRCPSVPLRLVAFGSLSLLVGQALLNIGVASGLLPTTGITLPLVSYGGSSILASAAAAGFLVRVAREANCETPVEITPEKPRPPLRALPGNRS